MADFLQMLKGLPEVLAESARSRARRNAQAHRLIAPPPAGTPLLVSLALAFEHTGIYLGGGEVAELNGDGCVKAVSLTRFINGTTGGALPIRNGTRIFAVCDAHTRRPIAAERTLKTAHEALSDAGSWKGYDFAATNCHLFTAACVCGVLPRDRRFKRLLGGGIASIGRLERLLAEALNDGHAIAWCAVRRGKTDFHYRLTPEKKARLRLEGK
ncbi:MAG: hypothetical protein IJJ84_07465 [Kiritimatiellae bacterium]|nr:hypothetical protein [Kiritimatiellia bacterium]